MPGTALLPEEKTMKTVAIVACSNGQKEEYRSQNEELARYLEKTGHKVLWLSLIHIEMCIRDSGRVKETDPCMA